MWVAVLVKSAEAKPFTGAVVQSHAWLSALNWYFVAVYILYIGCYSLSISINSCLMGGVRI